MVPHMLQPIFTDFAPQHTDLFGRHTVHLGHRFDGADSLFGDAALASLIERTPHLSTHVNTMDVRSHDPRTRREGTLKGLSGAEALDAVRQGRIWILLQQPTEIDRRYAEVLRAIYAELEVRVPGLRSFNHKMSILISSPKVQVYYHADVPGQTLWQVRGSKRVYVYPNTPPFLPQAALEKIVLGEAHEISLKYEPWFDAHAEVIQLEPGRMLHWPLNCPHRIINDDCLNVSFTTEHMTRELRNAYAVNYANGVLRRALGLERLPRPQTGLGLYARLGLAAAHKYSGAQARGRAKRIIDFEVDPAAPKGVRDVAPFALRA
jgi:hypothetical protein